MEIKEDKPWIRYLTAKYLRGKSFWNAKVSGEASWVWKSILSTRETLSLGACWKISSGQGVNIWSTSWVPKCSNFKPKPRIFGDQSANWVSELILSNPRRWDVPKINLCFDEESAKNIRDIQLGEVCREDKLIWSPSVKDNLQQQHKQINTKNSQLADQHTLGFG